MQQAIVILLATWLFIGLAVSLPAGRTVHALAVIAIPLLGYAGALALEFTLAAWVGREAEGLGSDPRGLHRWLGAWWGELRSAPVVFGYRQPFRSARWPDHLPSCPTPRRGALLIHGFVCNRGLWNPWLARLQASGIPYAAVNLQPVFGSIDDYVPLIDAAVARLEDATGLPPVVVAHSMGGLALRRWWAGAGNADRVHHAITLGTPHQGTWLARFAFSRNGRQMRIGSDWLLQLQRQEPPGRCLRVTSFVARRDNIVFPPAHAALEGSQVHVLDGVGHVELADCPEPFDALTRALAAQTPSVAPNGPAPTR